MSVDPIARGLAARAQASGPRVPIDICIIGQSNERGQVDAAETIGGVASRTAYPQAFESSRVPSFSSPVAPAVSRTGGFHFRLYDDLYDWGYEANIINLGIGSASFVRDVCGQVTAWNPQAAFRAARPAVAGSIDRGFTGDVIVESGKVFVATAGFLAFAMHNGPGAVATGSSVVNIDYIGLYAPPGQVNSLRSGATRPDFASVAAVGQVVPDGGMTWTCLSTTTNFASTNYATGLVLSEGQRGGGFDPYGILGAALAALKRGRGVYKVAILQNGQADAGTDAATYAAAMTNMASFLLASGNIHVMPGLTCYSPTIPTAAYDTLTTGMTYSRDQMLRTGPRASWVHDGANLYQLMGSSGAMAAGGAWLKKDIGEDDIHLNAPGAIEAGRHVADAVKAWLPRAR